jgi:hypothetical protein
MKMFSYFLFISTDDVLKLVPFSELSLEVSQQSDIPDHQNGSVKLP